jgi:hypothetical protein
LVEHHTLHKFASIIFGIEERDMGGCRDGHGKGVSTSLRRRSDHLAREIGHKEAREEEGGGDADATDVFLDFRFRIEMVDLGELAARNFIVSAGFYTSTKDTHA